MVHTLLSIVLMLASVQTATIPKTSILPSTSILPGTPGGPIPSIVQNRLSGGAGSSTLAFIDNVVSGDNRVIIAAQWYGGGSGLNLSVTDSQGNTFTKLDSANLTTDGDTMAVSCAPVTSGGADTITAKNGGAATAMNIIIYEIRNATCTKDVTGATGHIASSAVCRDTAGVLTITPVTNNDLILQICGTTSNDNWTPASGYYGQQGSFSMSGGTDTGTGQLDVTLQSLYTAASVSSGDNHGTARETVAILEALKPATGSAPTGPTVDAKCDSATITLSGTQTCTMTINASATDVSIKAMMDTATVFVTEVCLFPSANTYNTTCPGTTGGRNAYYLSNTVLSSPQNTIESWTIHNPPTGSIKCQVKWSSSADLSSMQMISLLTSNGFANHSGSTAAASPISNTITSNTNHLILDSLMEGQNSTCNGTAPSANAGQTVILGPDCNGSGNWFRAESTKPGASGTVTLGWTVTGPTGILEDDTDAF